MFSSVKAALRASLIGVSLGGIAIVSVSPVDAARFRVTNLVSDTGNAAHTDANLINPWGLASSPTGPFWVADNGTGVATIYNSAGTPQPLIVTVMRSTVPLA